jgi:PAT family beta-lactamase induction signal transducer AmpG
MLVVAFLTDHAANAMGSAVFVAFLMSRIDPAVSATQYALLTSLSSLAGRLLVPLGARLAATAGWPAFFLATFLISLPGLVLASSAPSRARSSAGGAASERSRS